MDDDKTVSRRERILRAALDTVGTYGYKRSSMNDIAKAVGISRPALYQLFANKADIYRAVVVSLIGSTVAAARSVLQEDGPLAERLYGALEAGIVEPHETLEAMPHGAELLGMKDEVAQDLMDDWGASMRSTISQALIERDGVAEPIAGDVSDMVMLAVAGLKASGADAAAMRVQCRRIASIMADAALADRQTGR